ncbi:MAG: twitching motility protein PilT, partial [Ignavibacteriae bacterium]|nr:twitching motility protein PilT [Ignavibacteriota bacterium]
MINKALEILSSFAKTIPDAYIGPDRTNYIMEQSEKLSVEDKDVLIKFFNHILTVMVDRTASDIEIGGPGTANYIWFRIQGIKQRVKDLPNLKLDESTMLIAALLNKNQHRHLMVNRNIDFSYTFRYIKNNVNVRFRADAYFDLDILTLNMRAISSNLRALESYEFHQYALQSM